MGPPNKLWQDRARTMVLVSIRKVLKPSNVFGHDGNLMAASKLRLLSLLVFVIGPLVLRLLFLPLLAHPIVKFGECLQDGRSPREQHHQADHGQEDERLFKREIQESLQQLQHRHLERLAESPQRTLPSTCWQQRLPRIGELAMPDTLDTSPRTA